MRVAGHVIHLARAVERRGVVDALIAALPFPARVLEAVDGRALGAAALQAHVAKGLLAPAYPFAPSAGEIACFLSHRAAWRRIVESGDDFGFVAEDDLGLEPAFAAALAVALEGATVGDYVSFQTRPLKGQARVVAAQGGVRLVVPRVVPLRTSAQLVGRGAAERLLGLTERFDRPVDCLLQMVWHTRQRMLVVEPSGVVDLGAAMGGSTIQAKRRKGLGEEALRSIRRGVYRWRIGRLSARA